MIRAQQQLASCQNNQPLLVRLDTLIETATAAFFDALDDFEKPTAMLYLQKEAQAANDTWQQTIQGHNGPTIMNPKVPHVEQSGPSSQHGDEDTEPTFASHRKNRFSGPQIQAQLFRLSDRTRLRRLKKTLHTQNAGQQGRAASFKD